MKNIFYSLLDFKNFEDRVKKIMILGIKISFVLLLFSTLFLSLYIQFNTPLYLYTAGTILFKTFSMYITFFVVYGICFNKIIKELK